MIAAAGLLTYAALLLAAGAPALARSAWPDRAPRLGIAAWLALPAAVITSVVLGGTALMVPTEGVSGGIAWLLKACQMALRAQYAQPGGAALAAAGGLLAVTMYVAIGTTVGALSGYHGGVVDGALSRLTDVVLSFPPLIIILFAVSVFGRPSLANVIVVLGLLGWPLVSRLVRGQFLALRGLEFVLAARATGASDARVVAAHLLPNAMAPVLVAATFGTANAILIEAALSFLGLGVQPPTPSWGNMLTDAQSLTILQQMPWLWVPPGCMILVAVLAINFVGDGLRDALDPSLRL